MRVKASQMNMNVSEMSGTSASMRSIPRVMITGVASGSGKTTMVCAILQELKRRQYRLAACKCGPDYIDPMFHTYSFCCALSYVYEQGMSMEFINCSKEASETPVQCQSVIPPRVSHFKWVKIGRAHV